MAPLTMAAVLLLPLATGLLLSAVVYRRPLSRPDSRVLGYGLLLGLLLAPAALRILDAAGLTLQLGNFLLLSCALLIAALTLYLRVRNLSPLAAEANRWGYDATGAWPARGLWLLLLLLIAVRLALLSHEALVRPLLPFDALMHWATKARVWFAQGEMSAFVENSEWLRRRGVGVYTDTHPDYPPTIPLLQMWMAIGLGRWSETIINIPWPLFALALLLIFYGQARAAGVSAVNAMVFTYLLISLPTLDTHVALAGYADFALGVCYGAALLALHAWQRERERSQLALAIVLALAATQLKNEGLFWALTLVPAGLAMFLPARRLLLCLLAGAGALVIALLLVPPQLTVAGHSLETLAIFYRPDALGALGAQLFTYSSWHLLGALLLLLLPGLWFARPFSNACLPLAVALFVALALYLFLFTATRFSYGAVNYTASARIALHLVPATMFLAALLWQALLAWQRAGGQSPGDQSPRDVRE